MLIVQLVSVYGDMEAELNHMLQEGEKIMEGCVGMWRNTGMTTARKYRGTYSIVWIRVVAVECKEGSGI